MGVRLVNLAAGQTHVAIARNAEEPVNGSADGDGETAPDGGEEAPDEVGDDEAAESADS
jgi:hypothetical protein